MSDFWEKVDQRGPDECWPWTGAIYAHHYGAIYWGRRMTYAHRVAYHLATGQDPAGKVVRHRCDNPPCCNPAHLEIGTHADNSRDRVERGRQSRGTRRPDAKLTEEDVLEIRRRVAAGASQAAVARDYGVGQPTVSKIIRRTRWKHV